MKKQFVALLVQTALLLALVPMTALAAEEFTIKDGVLVKYKGTGGAVTVPAGVTEIGPQAFANTAITAVTIPEGVTTIGKEAFMNCVDLAGVVIPNSVTSSARAPSSCAPGCVLSPWAPGSRRWTRPPSPAPASSN